MNPQITAAVAFSVLLAGCASTKEGAGRDQMTAQVGVYSPPAPGQQPIRIGVPAFMVNEGVEAKMSAIAADQITTLCANSQRFDVIERAQLDQLLKEQSLEGIVTGGELAKPAQVRGIEWILLGKVTSLRVKRSQTDSSFNLGSVPVPGSRGALGLFGLKNDDVVLKVECGVDLRLVDPSTGKTVVADFSEFDRTDAASAMGLQILGGNTGSGANIQVNADDEGRILRLALDDCMRKLLPKVDRALQQRQQASTAAATLEPGAAVPAAGAGKTDAAGAKFCSHCGNKLAAGVKFCAGCGTRTE